MRKEGRAAAVGVVCSERVGGPKLLCILIKDEVTGGTKERGERRGHE